MRQKCFAKLLGLLQQTSGEHQAGFSKKPVKVSASSQDIRGVAKASRKGGSSIGRVPLDQGPPQSFPVTISKPLLTQYPQVCMGFKAGTLRIPAMWQKKQGLEVSCVPHTFPTATPLSQQLKQNCSTRDTSECLVLLLVVTWVVWSSRGRQRHQKLFSLTRRR